MNTVTLCSRCVMPSTFPGIVFRDGLCSLCAQSSEIGNIQGRKLHLAGQIRAQIASLRGRSHYDCVVAFSGGKDSSYTLLMLVRELGLSCLAVTVDNGFVSAQAAANCKAVTAALGVDFVCYTPAFDFMKKLYGKSLTEAGIHTRAAAKRASSLCNSCIGLINSYMLQTAIRQGIPMIAGGYIGGQVPADAAVLSIDTGPQNHARQAALARSINLFGPAASRYFDIAAAGPAGPQSVVIINPMLATDLTEAQIIEAISELGWVRTRDTGLNSSNCRLNDLGIVLHYRKHGFHPYVLELSEQVRSGLMARDEALRRVQHIPGLETLAPQMRKLELDAAAL